MDNYSKWVLFPNIILEKLSDPVFSVFVLQKSFRTGTSTRLDDRVFSMCQLKYQPLAYSMLMIHPSLYRVDDLTDEVKEQNSACFLKTFIYCFFS